MRLVPFSSLIGCFLIGTAGLAAAQAPVPPPGYAAVAVALDDVLLPLISAAEQDAAQGRPALALARAQLVLESVATSSTLRVRAEGVRLVAQQALAGASLEAPTIDAVLEPLLTSSQSDSQRGLHALAIARLDFMLQRASPGGELALRAQAIRQATAQTMAAAAGSAPSYGAAPGYGASPPGYVPVAPQPGAAGYGAAGYGVAGSSQLASADPAQPAQPSDPSRRGDGEAIELYISAALFGAFSGVFVPLAANLDLEPPMGSTGDPEVLVYLATTIVGAGVMALGVLALDSGEGLRTGIGPSISMGLRYGLASGFLLWGALDDAFDPWDVHSGRVERVAMPFAVGLGGGLIGALIGYGFRPSTSQVRFVEASGIWGAGFGAFIGLAAAEDSTEGFALSAGGLGLALLTTSIMASAGAYTSPRRAWLLSLGFVIGTGVSGVVTSIGVASRLLVGDLTYQLFGGLAAVTSIAGLITVALLSDGMDERRDRGARAEIPVQLGIAPAAQGQGAIGTVSGSF